MILAGVLLVRKATHMVTSTAAKPPKGSSPKPLAPAFPQVPQAADYDPFTNCIVDNADALGGGAFSAKSL